MPSEHALVLKVGLVGWDTVIGRVVRDVSMLVLPSFYMNLRNEGSVFRNIGRNLPSDSVVPGKAWKLQLNVGTVVRNYVDKFQPFMV